MGFAGAIPKNVYQKSGDKQTRGAEEGGSGMDMEGLPRIANRAK